MKSNSKRGRLSGYSALEKKKFLFVGLLLLFPLAQFAVFYLAVNIESFKYAFTDETGKASLKYIKMIFDEFASESNNNLWHVLFRSFVTWVVGNLIVFPVSIVFTYALIKKVPGEMFFRILFFLPGIIGTVVLASIYRQLVTINGPLQKFLEAMGFDLGVQIRKLGFLDYEKTSFLMVLIFGVWCSLGGNIVVLTGAVTRIPPDIFEYGKIEGVGVWKEFFGIVLPLILPTVSTLFIFSLASIFTADSGTFLLFPQDYDGSAKTMGYLIFLLSYNVSKGVEVANRPAALGVVVTVATFPIVLTVRYFIEKYTEDAEF